MLLEGVLGGEVRAVAGVAGEAGVGVGVGMGGGGPAAGGGGGGAVLLALAALAALLLLALLGRRAGRALRDFQHMRKVAAAIPGPPPLPLVGNLLQVASGGEDHIYENCVNIIARYGSTVRIWMGPELVVAVSDPDDVEFLSTSQELTDKSMFYSILEPLLGSGLSCLGGQAVKSHRKIVSPSLHLDILHDFVDVFRREALRFADHLEPLVDGPEFDVQPLCIEHSLAAALQTIMSTELEDDSDRERRQFGRLLLSAMDIFMYRLLRPWFLHDQLFRLSFRRPEYVRTMHALNGFTETVIARKRGQLAARRATRAAAGAGAAGAAGAEAAADEAGRRTRRRAFLDNVMDNPDGAALSDLEIRDEAKTLLCTGSETSASTLAFVMMVLSLRQDVQDKLVQELDDVFGGDPSRPVTLEEVPHLQYLERVIKETLRMFPVLPFFTRACPRDVALPSGHTAPRGAHLAFFLPGLHYDARHWPEPRAFDPDRFLPENCRGRHPFAYLPFSAGPRNCVGQRYAMLLLKVEVATLLRRFRFLPPAGRAARDIADVPIKLSLVISCRDGVRVRIQRRHPNAPSL